MKMTRFGLAAFLGLAFAVSAGARGSAVASPRIPQQSPSPASAAGDSATVPVGTGIVGTLSTKLDSRHSKVGDPVDVEVTQDALQDGRVVLRRSSHITGHVTDISAYSKNVTNARLEIVFDTIIPKSGPQVSTHLAVFALAAKHDAAADNIQDPRGLMATSQTAGVNGGLGEPAGGVLKPDSKGVYKFDGISLAPLARDNPPTSLVHSDSHDIHLDKGTGIVLVVQGNTPPANQPAR